MRRLQPSGKGFTVVELLVVVAIMLLLSAMLWPVIVQARSRALFVSCISNLRQIYAALSLYTQDNNDRLPVIGPSNTGWIASVSPYTSTDANIWHCPAGFLAREVNYSVNPRLAGAFFSDRLNTSNTYWAGDGFEDPKTGHVSPMFGYTEPSLGEVVGGVSFRHGDQALFIFLDGHVRAIKRGQINADFLTVSSL